MAETTGVGESSWYIELDGTVANKQQKQKQSNLISKS
jgi:hypothetical protein